MKSISAFLLILLLASCGKDKATQPAPSDNSPLFDQNFLVIGTWRADSLVEDSTTHIEKGVPELGDSIVFSNPSFTGNIPNAEVKAWYISGASVIDLPEYYLWETANDSLYFKAGNHESTTILYRFGYSASLSRLIVHIIQTTISGTINRTGYYHKI